MGKSMKKELTPNEVIFSKEFISSKNIEDWGIPEYDKAYKKISRALSIEKEGYNLYLIDSFSKDKMKSLISYIEEQYKNLDAPKDICYVTLEDEKKPEVIFVSNGKGNKLKETMENLKNHYLETIEDFYNSSSNNEKDILIDEIETKRNDYISQLMDMAKKEGFDVKATTRGFAFIPLKDGAAMTEKEYDTLEEGNKDKIVSKVTNLKKKAEVVLDKLKDIELKSMKKLKDIYNKFLITQMEDYKDDILLEFITDDESYEYLERLFIEIEKDIIECYTMSLEDDENEIYEVLNKYSVQVLVDNSANTHPPIVYEEDPNVNNLMGNIEYENHNGVYTTDISLVTPGAIIKANEGCLILRLSALANNQYSYYCLKKTLLSNKVSYDTSKNYVELLSINGLKPEPIPVKVKVILIGDYNYYDVLYNNDEDFKSLFPLRAEFSSVIDTTDSSIATMNKNLFKKVKENKLLDIDESALCEIYKYLSRKCSSRSKIDIEGYDLDRILILSDSEARDRGSKLIEGKDIIKICYEKEPIEDEYMKMYKDGKILIDVTGETVGSINALSVIGTGFYSFGKPMRVTCVAVKGKGRIVDIHQQSNLSGKIHEKSISILRSILNTIFNPYDELPVDFYLSFEQLYGKLEGDSASVAEIVCILSALSKKPIKQNFSVTGSINQFGDVQPIGGVNEKIEGFYKMCNIVDTHKGKCVLIPSLNKDELVLSPEVESAIENGEFHIYTMDTLQDAIETLILNDGETIEEFFSGIEIEIKKYEPENKE